MKTYSESEVIAAIDAEEELIDEMPEEMWCALKRMVDANDRDGIIEALRFVVIETKRGIRERIRGG